MGHPRLTAGARDKRVIFEAKKAKVDGVGHLTGDIDWLQAAHPYANVAFGSVSEQREAAQVGGSQTASFAVLSDSETRKISVRDRIRYPLSDPDPARWPCWEIQAVAELGFNEGLAFTATRVAA